MTVIYRRVARRDEGRCHYESLVLRPVSKDFVVPSSF